MASIPPEPLLAPSVSPRLPYDSAEIDALSARSSSKSTYGVADLASQNVPDAAMQQSVFMENPVDSIDRNDSAGLDADLFAARAAAAAAAASEKPGVSAPPTGAKANKGMCTSCLMSWELVCWSLSMLASWCIDDALWVRQA